MYRIILNHKPGAGAFCFSAQILISFRIREISLIVKKYLNLCWHPTHLLMNITKGTFRMDLSAHLRVYFRCRWLIIPSLTDSSLTLYVLDKNAYTHSQPNPHPYLWDSDYLLLKLKAGRFLVSGWRAVRTVASGPGNIYILLTTGTMRNGMKESWLCIYFFSSTVFICCPKA